MMKIEKFVHTDKTAQLARNFRKHSKSHLRVERRVDEKKILTVEIFVDGRRHGMECFATSIYSKTDTQTFGYTLREQDCVVKLEGCSISSEHLYATVPRNEDELTPQWYIKDVLGAKS